MNPEAISRLRDIQGLDAVPWWPLATGWWLLMLAVLLLLLFVTYQVRLLLRYPAGSWRRTAWKQLRELRRGSDRLPANQIAGELSQLLRRIAIARLGRDRVAGLVGDHWLAWLTEHDPKGFDWTARGQALLTLPYAPPGSVQAGGAELLPLINAACAWVDRHQGGRGV